MFLGGFYDFGTKCPYMRGNIVSTPTYPTSSGDEALGIGANVCEDLVPGTGGHGIQELRGLGFRV